MPTPTLRARLEDLARDFASAALVAEQWSSDELRSLLADRVFSEGLTVRQLRRVLRPSRAKRAAKRERR
jgi:hypothetical protein